MKYYLHCFILILASIVFTGCQSAVHQKIEPANSPVASASPPAATEKKPESDWDWEKTLAKPLSIIILIPVAVFLVLGVSNAHFSTK